jgi:hypothetical protein
MCGVDLRTLRTPHFFAPERCAEYHADRDADGQPHADVSCQHTEHRAQCGA